jgi:hypothetical protein
MKSIVLVHVIKYFEESYFMMLFDVDSSSYDVVAQKSIVRVHIISSNLERINL